MFGHQCEYPNAFILQHGSDGKCVLCILYYNITLKLVSSTEEDIPVNL